MTQPGTVLGTPGETDAAAAPAGTEQGTQTEEGAQPAPPGTPDTPPAAAAETPPAVPPTTEEGTPATPPPDPGSQSTEEGGSQTDTEAGAAEEISLELVENAVMDQAALTAITEAATAQGLTQEQAQAMATQAENAAATAVKGLHDQYLAETVAWRDEVTADAELGGEKFDETSRLARAALDKYGSSKLKEALDKTGYGNHPELVRFCRNIGKAMEDDDGMVSGSRTAGESKTPQKKLYTHPTSGDGSTPQE